MSEELKPCPFCGSKNISISRYVRDKKPWHVHCPQSGCFLFGRDVCGYATEAEATAAWNRRTADEEIAEYQAQMKKLVEALHFLTGKESDKFHAALKQMGKEYDEKTKQIRPIPIFGNWWKTHMQPEFDKLNDMYELEDKLAAADKRIAELEELLRDFGRHNHGCSGDCGGRCKCGWAEEEANLCKQ